MKKEKENTRFYILIIILIFLSFIMSFFNYRLKHTIVIPRLDNSSYELIEKHLKLLKNLKKLT
jgi:hypothetical protein